MKQTLKWFRRSAAAIMAAAMAAATIASCSTEEIIIDDDNGGGDETYTGDRREVVFDIGVPQDAPPSTRAIAEGSAADNAVYDLLFLFFGEDGRLLPGDDGYSIVSDDFTPTVPGGGTYKKKVSVHCSVHKVIVMANWGTYRGGTDPVNYPIENMRRVALFGVGSGNGTYAQNFLYETFPSGKDFTETYPFHLMGSRVFDIFGKAAVHVELIRSLAKINVVVADNLDIKLERIRLVNFGGNTFAMAPHLPVTSYNIPRYNNYDFYIGNENAIEYNAGGATEYKDHIFMPESYQLYHYYDNPVPNNMYMDWRHDTTGLLIEVTLSSGARRWFRVNLKMLEGPREGSGGEYVAPRRNHIRTINITGIDGYGFATSDEAFNSLPGDMTVEQVAYDGGESRQLNDVVFDDRYYLATNGPIRKYSSQARRDYYGLMIYTNAPSGCLIANITGGDGWLTIERNPPASARPEVPANVMTSVPIEMTENTSMTDSRTATVTLTAGPLTSKFVITQDPRPWLRIDTQPKPLVGGVLDEHTLSRPGPDSYGPSWYDLTIAATPFNSSEPITYTWYVENWRVGTVPVPAEWTSDGGRTVNLTWKQLSSTGFCGHFHCVVSLPGAESIISETVTIWPEGGGLG